MGLVADGVLSVYARRCAAPSRLGLGASGVLTGTDAFCGVVSPGGGAAAGVVVVPPLVAVVGVVGTLVRWVIAGGAAVPVPLRAPVDGRLYKYNFYYMLNI